MAKTFTGMVVSDKSAKTIVVGVRTRKMHPLYRKQYTFTKKFMAHDEHEKAKHGDLVLITESKPLSARKRFVLTEILESARVEHTEPTQPEVLDAKKSEKEK